jgi:glycosyltransferase involved in cell wall biosynthesis
MSMADRVAVSVVIPCYNSAAFLQETVESVLIQTMRQVEVVFVDDGSSDGTLGVIEQLIASHRDRQLTVFSQVNAGVGAARNRGIAIARGQYVLPLDADDLIAPTMLERCARILDSQPQTGLVFTDRQDFGDITGVWVAGHFELERLKYFNQISYCSMFRREIWETIGGYRVNASGFTDWDFWVAAAARRVRGYHLPSPLLQHRRRADSHLGSIIDDYERLYATIIVNNQEVYSDTELAAAHRFLSTGETSVLLRSSKLIFAQNFPIPRERTWLRHDSRKP